MDEKTIRKSVAVVGLSGRFPNAGNLNVFWEKLKEGASLYNWHSDETLRAAGIKESQIQDETFIKIDTTLQGAETFDPSFFGYTKSEAKYMDPQTRILHEEVWLALEDAKCNPFAFDKKIGLIVSASENLDWKVYAQNQKSANVSAYYRRQISNVKFSNTLISYRLNLKGPSYFIDTACSSSLAGIHMATRQLLMKEASMYVVSSVSLNSRDGKGYYYQEGMISSKDGFCKPFDKDASGTFLGEGTGTVVLKRLEDAIKDGDSIYAVIRGSATNNDGNNKVGYTAPSIDGQASCIALAHRVANITPETIGYVETHGTATQIGDPIELEALNIAFKKNTQKQCAIGSIKSNLGHLDAAAGIAGFIKTVLSLHHKQIPPSLHYKAPNPKVNFNQGPFYVNDTLQSYQRKQAETPLRAGVSSFGIGGTNAHVILEEFNTIKKEESHTSQHQIPIMLSAKSTSSLMEYKAALIGHLQNNPSLSTISIFNALLEKAVFSKRVSVVASTKEELIGKLQELTPDDVVRGDDENTKPKLVFMFPGQGSQYENMAYELYKENSFFAAIIDDGLNILSGINNNDYKKVLFSALSEEETSGLLHTTEYTQPLVFLIEYALAKLLMDIGIQPTTMIGHSLGEYTAACISGVFSLEDALQLLVYRAALMEQTESGKMISVNCSEEEIIAYLNSDVSIAAINAPNAVVLSGTTTAIENLETIFKSLRIATIPLKTSKAFHSPTMDAILDDFQQKISTITLHEPQIPFISNLTGKTITSEEAISPKYWVSHIRNAVLFSKGMKTLEAANYDVFLEVGPGNILRNLYHRNVTNSSGNALSILKDAKNTENEATCFVKQLGMLWSYGIHPQWNKFLPIHSQEKTKLPNYVFEDITFPYKIDVYRELNKEFDFSIKNDKKPFNQWFYTTNWKLTHLEKTEELFSASNTIVLFATEDAFFTELQQQFSAQGKNVIVVKKGAQYRYVSDKEYSINVDKSSDFTLLYNDIKLDHGTVDHYIYGWSLSNAEKTIEIIDVENIGALHEDFHACLYILQAFQLQKTRQRHKFTLLTQQQVNIHTNEKKDFASASVKTLLYVAMQENLKGFNCTIDIDKNDEQLVEKVANDILYNAKDIQITYRNNIRWANFYESIQIPTQTTSSIITENGNYIITGGIGNAAITLATHLVTTYQAKVFLIGRSSMPEEENWEQLLQLSYHEIRAQKLEKTIRYIKLATKHKGFLHYLRGDITALEATRNTISELEASHGAINGIVHTAGNIDRKTYELVENIQPENVQAQMAPKVNGIINLHEIAKTSTLDFVWTTSSLSSVLGGITYASYAAANSCMDHFVSVIQAESDQKWVSVNLDGLSFGDDDEYIPEAEFIKVFERTLNAKEAHQWIVSIHDIYERDTLPKRIVEKITSTTTVNGLENVDDDSTEGKNVANELRKLWMDFFDNEEINLDSNYFELGGNSLNIIVMHQKIKELWNVDISIAQLFMMQTLKDIVQEVEKHLEKEETISVNDDTLIGF
ncbi:type I polyketide synthase [uncultured Kordia sp.]|uniref:type I polyketide synthase n=1 Tax=uncultured Kordia sp. TaxID=507699 RepID=UPI002613BD69|nr:type I polyketide synthase [uncultured Kordia sp.]